MKTWSLEGVVLAGIQAAARIADNVLSLIPSQAVAGGRDYNRGAEWLANKEAEEEVAEPNLSAFACKAPGPWDCIGCGKGRSYYPCAYQDPDVMLSWPSAEEAVKAVVQAYGPEATAAHLTPPSCAPESSPVSPTGDQVPGGVETPLPPPPGTSTTDLIAEVLAEHHGWYAHRNGGYRYYPCHCGFDGAYDSHEFAMHVAPLIAARIESTGFNP